MLLLREKLDYHPDLPRERNDKASRHQVQIVFHIFKDVSIGGLNYFQLILEFFFGHIQCDKDEQRGDNRSEEVLPAFPFGGDIPLKVEDPDHEDRLEETICLTAVVAVS